PELSYKAAKNEVTPDRSQGAGATRCHDQSPVQRIFWRRDQRFPPGSADSQTSVAVSAGRLPNASAGIALETQSC
ncbi:hypothetical protein ACU4GD_35010, partial [Cupriavidus basilensis]